MSKRWTIMPTDNGRIYWHLLNNNQDMPIEKTVAHFKEAMDRLNDIIYPIRMQATSDPEKAHITMYFCEDGDENLPKPFEDSLAYAYYPFTDRKGEQYYNDHYDWTNTRRFSLTRTIMHETLHSLGIPHNEIDKECLMTP
jgi:hypothetical protein